jgi:hypothetical protein
LLGEDPAPIASIRPHELEHRVADIPGWDGQAGRRAAEVIAATLASEQAKAFA